MGSTPNSSKADLVLMSPLSRASIGLRPWSVMAAATLEASNSDGSASRSRLGSTPDLKVCSSVILSDLIASIATLACMASRRSIPCSSEAVLESRKPSSKALSGVTFPISTASLPVMASAFMASRGSTPYSSKAVLGSIRSLSRASMGLRPWSVMATLTLEASKSDGSASRSRLGSTPDLKACSTVTRLDMISLTAISAFVASSILCSLEAIVGGDRVGTSGLLLYSSLKGGRVGTSGLLLYSSLEGDRVGTSGLLLYSSLEGGRVGTSGLLLYSSLGGGRVGASGCLLSSSMRDFSASSPASFRSATLKSASLTSAIGISLALKPASFRVKPSMLACWTCSAVKPWPWRSALRAVGSLIAK